MRLCCWSPVMPESESGSNSWPLLEFPSDPTDDLPHVHGGPPLQGFLRVSPEDFQVHEILGYEACGEGEHAFLKVRKRGLNTADVARTLAQFAGVRQVNVGFAGLKDRHAVTTQFFSVHLPGKESPDWSQLHDDSLQVLDAQRHNRKIRRGSLRGNRFRLVLRDLRGDTQAADAVCNLIASEGVPNYFGPQRFGRDASNLHRAARFLAGEGKRPKPEQLRMILSAARSYLFNAVLAERVRQGNWQQALAGEVLLLDGSNRQFLATPEDQDIDQRIRELDIHPSGPMPGQAGRTLQPEGAAAELEQLILGKGFASDWVEALVAKRADSERRSLRLIPDDFSANWLGESTLELQFSLPSGAFATTVVRELMHANSASTDGSS